MVVALVVGIGAELLVVGCAVAARRLQRGRGDRLRETFARAQAEARRLALDARIVEASMAELSELVVSDTLRRLGLEHSADQG